MSPALIGIGIGVGVVILIVLISYALHLQGRLKALEEKQRSDAREAEAQRQQRVQDAAQGIRVLAGAMVREEVTLTEGCMRVAYLLTQVDQAAKEKQTYSVFFQLASATAHIPVLDAWKELPRQQKHAYTKERISIEAAFEEFVMESAQNLLRDPMLDSPQ